MELVLGHHRLTFPGGSETYLLTVAEQLQRLGHEITIFAVEVGEMAQAASIRGLRVVTAEHELPRLCDGVMAQDGVVSLTLAARYPEAPQVFVAHAAGFDLQRPVQLDGVVSAVVVLNDRIGKRLEGLSHQHEVVRLRQPVDIHRFTPRREPRPEARSAVLLSNTLRGAARRRLEQACEGAGLRLEHVGQPERPSVTPELDLAAADVVVGQGRAAIEGMAVGRAVYVLDHGGSNGWVTPASYPTLEANGFASIATEERTDVESLRRDLTAYRAEMGLENRELARAHHAAMDHATELVTLLRRLSGGGQTPHDAPLREMARLVRLQWQTEGRVWGLALQNEALREDAERERTRANELEAELLHLKRTRRYRLASLLARPLDALRRRR